MLEYNMITKQELETGIKSNFWKAFETQLKISKKEQLELISKLNESIEIHRCQGRIQVLEDLLFWPEVQIEAIDADEKFKEGEEKDASRKK